jgi:nucleoside-diphosphate-sugar epimerase
MISCTVIGGGGFIGAALAARLRARGDDVWCPPRDAVLNNRPLGQVYYCAGVTGDFLGRPFDTLQAHVGLLTTLLECAEFSSLVYLSSTRVYRRGGHGREDQPLVVDPTDPQDLYDLTKLAAESLCATCGRQGVRVARLSNVVGQDFASANFLYELLRGACEQGEIRLRSALDSHKDYIVLDDVLDLLPRIAMGNHGCYNVAAGLDLPHHAIVDVLVQRTGARLVVEPHAPRLAPPLVDTSRIRGEFGFEPRPAIDYIAALVDAAMNRKGRA